MESTETRAMGLFLELTGVTGEKRIKAMGEYSGPHSRPHSSPMRERRRFRDGCHKTPQPVVNPFSRERRGKGRGGKMPQPNLNPVPEREKVRKLWMHFSGHKRSCLRKQHMKQLIPTPKGETWGKEGIK